MMATQNFVVFSHTSQISLLNLKIDFLTFFQLTIILKYMM